MGLFSFFFLFSFGEVVIHRTGTIPATGQGPKPHRGHGKALQIGTVRGSRCGCGREELGFQRSNASSETGSTPVLGLCGALGQRGPRQPLCPSLPSYLPLSQTKPTIKDHPPRNCSLHLGALTPTSQPHWGSQDSSIRHRHAFPSWKLLFGQQQQPGRQRVSLKWILCLLQHPGWGISPPSTQEEHTRCKKAAPEIPLLEHGAVHEVATKGLSFPPQWTGQPELLPTQGRRKEEVAQGQSHPLGYLELQPRGRTRRRGSAGWALCGEDRRTCSDGCNPKTSFFTTNFTPLKPFREGKEGSGLREKDRLSLEKNYPRRLLVS